VVWSIRRVTSPTQVLAIQDLQRASRRDAEVRRIVDDDLEAVVRVGLSRALHQSPVGLVAPEHVPV
jgi:hypothetical protein